jgi:hypothetical protein
MKDLVSFLAVGLLLIAAMAALSIILASYPKMEKPQVAAPARAPATQAQDPRCAPRAVKFPCLARS